MITRFRKLFIQAKNHQGFRRYAANTSWMFAEQILRMVAGLLVGIWVARYLGPSQFGVFSYAVAFAALFGSIAKLGLDSIVVRDLVNEPDKRDLYLGTAFWLKLMGAVVMLGVMALAVQFTSNDATTNLYIFIIASGTIFQSFEVVDFYFQSKVISRLVSICKLVQLFISSLLKLYLILTGADLFWFVFVSLVDQITLALSLYLAYKFQKINGFFRSFDLVIAKNLLRNSWPLVFSGLIVMIYMRIDQIMIKEILGEKEVGLYSAAIRLSEVWYFVPIIVGSSLYPSIINAKKINKELFHFRLQRLYTMLVWTALSVAFFMTFLSDSLVVMLYGEIFKESGPILMIHIWTGVFVALGVGQSYFWIANNLQSKVAVVTGFSAIVNIILNYFFIPIHGAIGAASATLISYAIGSLIFPWLIKEAREMVVLSYKAFIFRLN